MIKYILYGLFLGCFFWQAFAIASERSGIEPLALLPMLVTQDSVAQVVLGKKLFFDPVLSVNNQMSCATCHDPQYGWGDGKARSIGVSGVRLPRHTPSLFNTGYQTRWFWDGRVSSLEAQSLGPIQGKHEMGQDLAMLLKELEAIPVYPMLFEKAFGRGQIRMEWVSSALAAFERTLLSNQSTFDLYLQGDQKALSASAKRGLVLFETKARCILCHQGSNFSDRGFHNIGLKTQKGEVDDLGHFAVIPIQSQKGSFKTPTLRSIASHPPYMHDGSLMRLKDVVAFYNRGGDVAENRDPQIQPLSMTPKEQADLVAFLNALNTAPADNVE